jgi:putative FmdB family regulatory protein
LPPVYDYLCGKCGSPFEEFRGIKAYDSDASANCPHCSHLCGSGDRDFSRASYSFIGTNVQNAEFNPGLGQVVKSAYHKKEILKEKGLVEVGNDFNSGEKMQTHFDKRKAEEREKRWQTGLGEIE